MSRAQGQGPRALCMATLADMIKAICTMSLRQVDRPRGRTLHTSFKQRLAARDRLLGLYVTYAYPGPVELYARHCGFDWLWLDLEHAATGLETMQTLLQAMNGSGCASLVRVPWNDHVWIKRVLDIGPDGIVLPMVSLCSVPSVCARRTSGPQHPPSART